MKKVILTAFLLIPLSVQAQEADMSGYCGSVGDMARIVMEKRLVGVSMRDMFGITGDNPMTAEMTMQAYGAPDYRTEAAQERAIREFETKWYLDCLRNTQ